jgi:PAS domain S-box-containing protein
VRTNTPNTLNPFKRNLCLWSITFLTFISLGVMKEVISTKQDSLAHAESDHKIFDLANDITSLIHHIQLENSSLSSTLFTNGEVESSKTITDQYLDKFINLHEEFPSDRITVGLNGFLEEIHQELLLFRNMKSAIDEKKLFSDKHIKENLDFNTSLVESTKRLSFYIQDTESAQQLMAFSYMLHSTVSLEQQHSIASAAISTQKFEPSQHREILASEVETTSNKNMFKSLANKETLSEYQKIYKPSTEDHTIPLSDIFRALTYFDSYNVNFSEWWKTQKTLIESHHQLEQFIISSQQEKLTTKQSKISQELTFYYIILAALLIFLAGLVFLFYKQDKQLKLTKNSNKALYSSITATHRTATIFLLMLGLTFEAMTSIRELNHQTRQQMAGTLADMVGGAHNIFHDKLIKSTLNQATDWASDPLVISSSKKLLRVSVDSEKLKNHPSQNQLRDFFLPRINQQGMRGVNGITGIFIISKDYVNIASMSDSNLGGVNITRKYRPQIIEKVLAGKPSFIPPVKSDVPLNSESGRLSLDDSSIFIATPIFDSNGVLFAALMVRYDPAIIFSGILNKIRLLNTGETYAFDREGRLLSQSRFHRSLVNMGLISKGQNDILNIQVREPQGISSDKKSYDNTPLTLMAQSATKGMYGSSSSPYLDYRGTKVIGAWVWDDDLGIGMATEVDEIEVTQLITAISKTAIAHLSLMLLFVVVALATFNKLQAKNMSLMLKSLRENKTQKKRAERALTKLESLQEELTAIVDTALDGIVVTDNNGVIQNVNSALTTIFGYSEKHLIGSNVTMLMPEHYHKDHNANLKNHKANLFALEREMMGRRVDGSEFPVELTVSQFSLGTNIRFAGVIRDISARKQAENQLLEERSFSKNIIDSLPEHIVVLDNNGIIVFVNKWWNQFAEENNLSADLVGPGIDYMQLLEKSTGAFSEGAVETAIKLRKLIKGDLPSFQTEYPCHSPTNQRWFEMRAQRVSYRGSAMVIISHINITPRIVTEKILEGERKELRTLNETLSQTQRALKLTGIAEYWLSPEGQLIYVTDEICSHLGYSHEELLRMKVKDFDTTLSDMSNEQFKQRLKETQELGSRRVEAIHKTKDGRLIPVEKSIVAIPANADHDARYITFIVDISARKNAEEQLNKERVEIEALNQTLSQTNTALQLAGICEYWLSIDAYIIYASDETCKHLGYSRDELFTMQVSDIDVGMKNLSEEQLQQHYEDTIKNGWRRYETVHKTKKGQLIPVEKTVVFIPETTVHESRLITFIVDITSRKRAEEERAKALKAAEQANQAKSTFLATMSHEIRTPLNGVVSTIDLLNHTELSSYQQDLVSTADDSSHMLQSVIDDILDFSKIEAGKIELDYSDVQLNKLAETVGTSLGNIALDKNVELLIYCDPELPQVMGDTVRLKQLLFNLTGNAIKFSANKTKQQGQVLVSFTIKNQNDNNVSLCLQVRDNGIGMSPEVQQRLFKPFMQGEEQTTRSFGGTGLGLVITKRLIELMGGRIELESEEGKGSTFSVYLTLEKSAPAPKDNSDLQGLQLLLLNAGDDASMILEHYLRHTAAEITVVDREHILEECTRLCSTHSELIVIIDNHGDDENFAPLREQLRKQAQGAKLKFLIIERGKRHFARLISEDEISLDLNIMHRSALLNAVAATAGRESTESISKGPSRRIENRTLPTPNDARASGQLILLAEDNKTNQKVIQQQLNLLGYAAEIADNGLIALSMWRQSSYGLLLTDCHMPEMDGYELASYIRKEEQDSQRMPIIAITADALKGTANRCHKAGMDAYLTKPMQLTQLQEALDKWLPSEEIAIDSSVTPCNHQPQQQAAEPTDNESKDDSAIDSSVLPELLSIEDPEQLLDIYQDYLTSTNDGHSELISAWDKKDLEAISQIAHKLKSSAKTVGASTLAECCIMLEQAGKGNQEQIVEQELKRFTILLEQVQQWITNYQGK